jgi:hypothetical protein
MKKKIYYLIFASTIVLALLSLAIPTVVLANNIQTISIESGFTLLDNSTGTKIPNGSTVIHYNTGITEVRDFQNKTLMRINDISSAKIQLPRKKVSATYVYEVPDGSNINLEDDGSLTISKDGLQLLTVIDFKRMKNSPFFENVKGSIMNIGLGNSLVKQLVKHNTIKPQKQNIPVTSSYLNDLFGSWVENAHDVDVDYMKNFSAYWNVPSSPTGPYWGATNIYLFNAVEDSGNTDIIQPVTYYSAQNGWMCFAMCGIDGNYTISETTSASVGNSIKGVINHGPIYWAGAIFNLTTGLGRSLTATGVSSLNTNAVIFCTLEAYGVNNNAQMPGDTVFSNISVKNNNNQIIDLTWVPYVEAGWALNLPGLSVSAPSDSTVYLNTAN